MAERSVGSASGFRWRGGEVSRLEGFTDAVFAIAVTRYARELSAAVLTGTAGLASIAITLLLGPEAGGRGGWIYFANGPIRTIHGF